MVSHKFNSRTPGYRLIKVCGGAARRTVPRRIAMKQTRFAQNQIKPKRRKCEKDTGGSKNLLRCKYGSLLSIMCELKRRSPTVAAASQRIPLPARLNSARRLYTGAQRGGRGVNRASPNDNTARYQAFKVIPIPTVTFSCNVYHTRRNEICVNLQATGVKVLFFFLFTRTNRNSRRFNRMMSGVSALTSKGYFP